MIQVNLNLHIKHYSRVMILEQPNRKEIKQITKLNT